MQTAIVGVGRMGRRHIKVIQGLGLSVSGVCDLNPSALDEAVKEGGISSQQTFSDVSKMFSSIKPKLVVIATTAPSHLSLVELAIQAGATHILCEKPLAVSLEDCDRMIAMCEQHGVRLGVNHQMRYMEQYLKPKELIQSEDLGGVKSITVVAGNFGMAMNGTHYFEMFRFMTDEEPIEVTAWFSSNSVPNPRGHQFQDRAGSIRMTTPTGKRFYLEIGDDQGHGLKVIYACRNGLIQVDELTGKMTWCVREKQYRDLPTTRYGMPAIEESRLIAPADVISPSQAVLNDLLHGSVWPDGRIGRLSVAALVAGYVSDESGHRPVRIDENLPLNRVFPWA